jgi:O-antigen/teichoic acid export membrane protein
MSKKLIQDISASSVQVILNQALGLVIFLIISRWLDKSVYGELNWSLAVLGFITSLLSGRLEQIIVKKVASGDNPSKMLTLFSGHIFFSGMFFYLALFTGSLLFPAFFNQHSLLLVLAISHILSFFSSPFKQIAAGRQKFGWLAIMSSAANLVRAIWLVAILLFSSLTIHQVLLVYIFSSLAEFLISIWIVRTRMQVWINAQWAMQDYYILIRESLPQISVVFLNACIARIDWILLGIFTTQVVTAEYSFAYKIFELSPAPMLILGPVLLTRFSGYFSRNTESSLKNKVFELNFLVRIEMLLATFLPLVLNVIWGPLIDWLTGNKYGAVNRINFLLLSCCIPLQYLINLFWTIHFSLNHLGLILRITAVTCTVIVAGDLLLIPMLNARGAAIAYLSAMIIEYFLYLRYSPFINLRDKILPLIVCMAIAFISGAAGYWLNMPVVLHLFLSVMIYGLLVFITGQFRKDDLRLLQQWLAGSTSKSPTA